MSMALLRRLIAAVVVSLAIGLLTIAHPGARQAPAGAPQAPPAAAASKGAPVTPADYGKWQTLGLSALSDNGRWLAVPITRVDGTASLDVILAAPEAAPPQAFYTAAEGRAPAFSSDSQWVAYRIGMSETEREKLQDEKKPVRDKLGLVRLDPSVAKPEPVVVPDVARFAFAPAAPYLAMLRYTPEGSKRAGADLLVRSLATGAVTSFGNVSDFAWQDEGRLLAFTIDAEGKAGNGVQVFDPQTGQLRLLDSGDAMFSGLAWREKDDDLACFRSRTDEGFEGDTQVVLAWRDLARRALPQQRRRPTTTPLPRPSRQTPASSRSGA